MRVIAWFVVAFAGCRPGGPASVDRAPLAEASASGERDPQGDAAPAVKAVGSDAASPPAAPPAPGGFVELPVEGFGPSILWVPPEEETPRPLLVAAHGAGGRPEHHCVRWIEVLGERFFVLCTRGHPMNRFAAPEEQGFFYDGHVELGREAMNALASLGRHFGGRVDLRGAVYAGYSQGATMGAHFLHARADGAAVFSYLMMIEGGSDEWNIPLSEKFRAAGGKRVLFACGQSSCNKGAERSRGYLEKAGVEASVRYAEGAGHTYLGEVGVHVEEGFDWLTRDDPRWQRHAPR